ncbi:DNA/RNA non-specific endonuclease [Mucilaginibacter myungsuensis]|uniref:DNA/RNA non-specific endonuclease n=1 Tax=Mucilaginibacter myungsuensis TaxID=649104 RepID=A0A929KUS3_9SPHI|nr:DNA/RNA non-specific endonuclease [Mucilaginibacter myungsuensis]MBE9661142.1 DNA/RNA non-specific endonuclease [Mucilaginibacter myungsuensis]MDN3597287.1 DNA/RNA non-specific endonuclease [Mucilaginibacter myungsuensis]
MRKPLLITFTLLTLFTASCTLDTRQPIQTAVAPAGFSLAEDMEKGVKAGYATGNVTLTDGSWTFVDALIGTQDADAKNGTRSARLRNGYISMNFDIANVSSIKISHAKYGNDADAKWQLMISTDGGATYTQLGDTINETSTDLTTDIFAVTDTGNIRFKLQKKGNARINIDDIVISGKGTLAITADAPRVPVNTGGGIAAEPRPIDKSGDDVQPVSGDNSNMLMGNPSGAKTSLISKDNYLIDMGYYVESYNATRGTPNWVSWHLDNSNTTGTADRMNDFAAWSDLPKSFFAVQSNSYMGSGFDRGHNCPSADRTSSTAANSATFLMTNMIPQAPKNNQDTWSEFEQHLRRLARQGNEVYIIMGCYGEGGIGSASSATVKTLAKGKITVPSNIWKVAVILPAGNGDIIRTGSNARVIAINTPNVNTVVKDWRKYIVTVRSIEQATGYDLLSALPQRVQDELEVGKDRGI